MDNHDKDNGKYDGNDIDLCSSGLTQLWCTGLQSSLLAISPCQSSLELPSWFRRWFPKDRKLSGPPRMTWLQVQKTYQPTNSEATTRLNVKSQRSLTRKRIRTDLDSILQLINHIWCCFPSEGIWKWCSFGGTFPGKWKFSWSSWRPEA